MSTEYKWGDKVFNKEGLLLVSNFSRHFATPPLVVSDQQCSQICLCMNVVIYHVWV